MCNCLPQIYKGSLAHIWWAIQTHCRRLLQCGLGGQKHHHSISGYSFHMGARAILWSSKKQHVVALSSTEAEYITQMHTAKEGLWLCSFLWELHSVPDDPLIINCDNQGMITLTKDNKFHTQSTSTCTTTSFAKWLRTKRLWSNTF